MSGLQRTCAFLLVVLASSLAGCTQTDTLGESLVGHSLSTELRALRDQEPTGTSDKAWGVSPEARSIERNVGVGR